MEHFAFNEPADVYVGGGRLSQRSRMIYRRFRSGADAIRFAMEQQSADQLAGTIVEADEARYGPTEIRSLYESEDYPLPRRQAS